VISIFVTNLSPDLVIKRAMAFQEVHTPDHSLASSFTTVSTENSPKQQEMPDAAVLKFSALYSENVIAKLWRVAAAHDQKV